MTGPTGQRSTSTLVIAGGSGVVLCAAGVDRIRALPCAFASLPPCALRWNQCTGGRPFFSGQRMHDASRHEQAQAHSSRAWPGSGQYSQCVLVRRHRHAHAHRIRALRSACVPHGMMGSTWRSLGAVRIAFSLERAAACDHFSTSSFLPC